jgi:outer membrane protein OmpA-like peptidoglycan-associated protein
MDTPERHFDKDNIVAALGKTPSVCDAVAPSAAPAPPATPPTAPAPPVPPAAPVPPKDDGSNVERLAPVRTMLGFDNYDLTQDGMAALRTYADGLVAKKAASMSIRVLGHADSIGQPYHNLRLSQMRAITVRNYLQTYLLNSSRATTNLNIDFNGAGTTQPLLDDEKCPGKGMNEQRVACLQPNRRVDVVATWAGSK